MMLVQNFAIISQIVRNIRDNIIFLMLYPGFCITKDMFGSIYAKSYVKCSVFSYIAAHQYIMYISCSGNVQLRKCKIRLIQNASLLTKQNVQLIYGITCQLLIMNLFYIVLRVICKLHHINANKTSGSKKACLLERILHCMRWLGHHILHEEKYDFYINWPHVFVLYRETLDLSFIDICLMFLVMVK